MFLVKKGDIKEIRVVSIDTEGLYTVQDIDTTKIYENIHKSNICRTYEEAEFNLKENIIKSKYKQKRKNKNGLHTCNWCGKKGKNLTVDHIRPLISFGGKKLIRNNERLWRRAWSFSNLQILCEECNKNKDSYTNDEGKMSLNDIDYHARILNNKKVLVKSVYKNSPMTKIGHGIATGKWSKRKREMAEYCAKADSSILRLDCILNSKDAHDLLPKTL